MTISNRAHLALYHHPLRYYADSSISLSTSPQMSLTSIAHVIVSILGHILVKSLATACEWLIAEYPMQRLVRLPFPCTFVFANSSSSLSNAMLSQKMAKISWVFPEFVHRRLIHDLACESQLDHRVRPFPGLAPDKIANDIPFIIVETLM